MKTFIALLRGINVGGHGKLPMKQLITILQDLGCEQVETYIQSGNAVFRSVGTAAGLATRLATAIQKQAGFTPRVLMLEIQELVRAAKANPFLQADAVPTSLHLFFLSAAPKAPDLAAIEAAAADGEAFALAGKVFYLYAPAGFGISKLAARAEKWLGVDATARNWRTVNTLIEMANGLT